MDDTAVDVEHLRDRTWQESHGATVDVDSVSVADAELCEAWSELWAAWQNSSPAVRQAATVADYEQQ